MRWELNEKQVHHYPAFWIMLVLFIAFLTGLTMNWSRLNRRYQRWNEEKHLQRAAASFASGDYAKVLIDARSALDINHQNPEAIRLIAQSLEAQGSTYSGLLRRQLDTIKPGDAENLLALTSLSVRSGDWDAAEDSLGGIKPADQTSARFHEMAANIATARNRQDTAETHWAAAVHLEPANETYQLGLATVQLHSTSADARASARQTLEAMSRNSPKHLEARRVLIKDAWEREESGRLLELTTALATDPDATFTDKLIQLSAFQKEKKTDFPAALSRMQDASAQQPEEVFQLVTWMNEHYLALLVPEWEGRLAPEIATKIPVCVAMADAYARGSSWDKLIARIQNASWEHLDFLRLTYLARARDRLHDVEGSDAAWKQALTAAQSRPEYLEKLGKLVQEWNWPGHAEEAFWKLSTSEACPRWVAEYLWTESLKKNDTALLCKASWLKLRQSPKDLTARNNYANLALLVGQDTENARRLALADYHEAPLDPNIATTYGLSMTQQDKPESALTAMEKFSGEQLQVPIVATYYGIFLAAAGQAEKAEQFLKLGNDAALLPEERALASKATAAVPIEAITNLGR